MFRQETRRWCGPLSVRVARQPRAVSPVRSGPGRSDPGWALGIVGGLVGQVAGDRGVDVVDVVFVDDVGLVEDVLDEVPCGVERDAAVGGGVGHGHRDEKVDRPVARQRFQAESFEEIVGDVEVEVAGGDAVADVLADVRCLGLIGREARLRALGPLPTGTRRCDVGRRDR